MESIADRIRATRQSFNVEPPQKNNQLIASPEVKQSNSQALTNTIEIQSKSTVQSAKMKNFAEKINRLLADENLANVMGKAGRQRVLEKFSWESIAKTTFNYYQEVINRFEKEKA